MPITLITGVPGSGKTAMLVKLLIELKPGADGKKRTVYVDGVPELALPHEVLEKGGERWHEPGVVADGSLIVIDEVQRYWRTRSSGSKVPPAVAALETHRHRGLDFIIVTQNEGLIDSNVRNLVGRHIHIRNLGVLGRRQYEWPECGDSDRFRSAPIQLKYSLPKGVFGRYKSASLHVEQTRRIPPSVLVAGGAACLAVGLGLYAWKSISSKVIPGAAVAPSASLPASGVRPGAPGGPGMARPGQPGAWRPVTDEPYEGLGVHMAGCVGDVCMWALTIPHRQDRPAQYFTTTQLALVGYEVKVIGPCAGLLTFGKIKRRVTCDQPAQQALPGRPGAPSGREPVAPALPGAEVQPVSL